MDQVEIDYHAGKWVPSYYGSRFVVASKEPTISRVIPEWKMMNGFTQPERTILVQQDTSVIYDTLTEARDECDRRNSCQ